MDEDYFDVDLIDDSKDIDEDQLLLNDATFELLKKTQTVLEEFDPNTRKKLTPTLDVDKDSIAQPEQNVDINNKQEDAGSRNNNKISQDPKKPSPNEKNDEDETFYVNVADFVVSYLSKVYAKETTQTSGSIWLNDWWAYPAIVARINSIWMSWEKSYKSNQLDTWFLHNAEPMMQNLMNKETGLMVHYSKLDNSNLVTVKRGEYLPTKTPPMDWYQKIADELSSIGRAEIERQKRLTNNSMF